MRTVVFGAEHLVSLEYILKYLRDNDEFNKNPLLPEILQAVEDVEEAMQEQLLEQGEEQHKAVLGILDKYNSILVDEGCLATSKTIVRMTEDLISVVKMNGDS